MATKQRANYYLKTKQLVGKNSSFEIRKAKGDLTPTKKQLIENQRLSQDNVPMSPLDILSS